MVGEDYRITDVKTLVLKETARTFPGARHPVDVGFAPTGTEWRSGAALTDRGAVERSFICLQM